MKLFTTILFIFFMMNIFANTPEGNCGGLFTKLGEFDELKSGDQVWGKYTCKTCKTEDVSMKPNSSGQQACPSCGSPHTDESYNFGIQKNAKGKDTISSKDKVSGKEEKTKASSGKKWSCSFCQTSNFATDARCLSCGADKAEGKKLTLNAKTTSPKRNVDSSNVPTEIEKPRSLALPIVGGVAAVGTIGGGAYWALSTKEYSAKVVNLRWAHQFKIERYTKVKGYGFKIDIPEENPIMPVNGVGERAGAVNFRNCSQEIHHYTPEYKCGTREVTKYRDKEVPDGQDCGMVDNGNGSGTYKCRPKTKTIQVAYQATEDVMCKDPVKAAKCDYDTYEWVEIDTQVVTGGEAKSNEPLPWPEVKLGPVDRKIPSEGYEVVFNYETDKGEAQAEKVRLNSEAEFKSFNMSTQVKVFHRNIGGISKWEKVN